MRRILKDLWQYLWQLNDQTKSFLRLDGSVLIENNQNISDDERELARKLFSDGGQVESQASNDDGGSSFDTGREYGLRKKVGFVLGPLLFLAIILAPTPANLDPSGQAVAAGTAWVAAWWMSEAIPIPATALLPIVLFPLSGALETGETTPSYADPLIFLFVGGFFVAMAMQRWDLHRRIALRTITVVGTDPKRIILGFVIATAFLSAWVSNTATAVLMVPIALAVIYQVAERIEQEGLDVDVGQGEFAFGTALMLTIGYSSLTGGLATLIGSPPNLLFAGAAEQVFDQSISFADWMMYGAPIAVVSTAMVYIYVTRFALPPEFDRLPGGSEVIEEQLSGLGAMTPQEKYVLIVFAGMAIAWVSAGFVIEPLLPWVDEIDTVIAITGAMILFLIPTTTEDGERTFLLNWTNAVEIPWGVVLLFGGGLAIAEGFEETGLAQWIGEQLAVLAGFPFVFILFIISVLIIFLSEFTSNTATTAMIMPVLASLSIGLAVHPYAIMVLGVTAASFAFMLPTAAPPNAIVFGSGYITIPQMVKVGIGLNIIGIFFAVLSVVLWLPIIWGIDLTVPPTWAS